MDAMGVLPGFAGIAVHDAWAPYDTYAACGHQLCCAHAARELRAVADLAPAGQWCWAAQAGEALAAMQRLAANAIAQHRDAIDPAALAAQIRLYRSAALIGIKETAARSGQLMKKHNALARRLLDRHDDYLRFTRDFRIPPDNNIRTRHPHGETPAESLGVPANPDRRQAILRDPKLPVDRRKARHDVLRRPCHAHGRPALDARPGITTLASLSET